MVKGRHPLTTEVPTQSKANGRHATTVNKIGRDYIEYS